MIDLLRRVSLSNRVLYMALAGAVFTLVVGLWAAQRLHAAGQPEVAAALVALSLAGALAGLCMGWAIRRSIKAPVEDTVQALIRIAGGDLETKVESPGRDELSWLRAELNGMRKKLRAMVLEVRATVDGVSTAAQEIARGNADLSTRTENQASSLQQTSSAMEQLAGTVRQNAEHAGGARDEVQQTTGVAERGGQLMADVVQRMQDIHVSAARINEIIGVIDGIAFQTNILALNAAVEAARAGDQGRGFAVVAAEVRSLAQRSAGAAREVKALIGDSSAKVDAGAALVGQAGETMQDILRRVAKVSALVQDMARAGQLQTQGIGQAQQAVSEIDAVTQQNAALVEQAAAASLQLREQAERLSRTVGAFRVTA
jgi:methyl-accepting chemotaxis protein